MDEERIHDVRFWVAGDSYKFWGLWEGDRHLIGVEGRRAVTDPSQSIYGVDLDFDPRCDRNGDAVIDASDLAQVSAPSRP